MVDIALHTCKYQDSEKYLEKNETAYALLLPFTTNVGPSQVVGTA